MNSSDTTRQPVLGFTSDNIVGVSPEILAAITACNQGQNRPYGNDDISLRVEQHIAELFEHDVSVFLVPTGTSANVLSLSVLTPPWGGIMCHPLSHINNDECGAPEFYTGGAKLLTVDGPDAKINAEVLRAMVTQKIGNVHTSQPASVSITQATEVGSLYSLEEISQIADVCKAHHLGLHMDGSRFANALVSFNCSPAEMTWKAGVDILSLGATKNGAMCVEAIVSFNKKYAAELAFRRKRAGHLFSKTRFLAAQMETYLHNDLWLNNARQANKMAKRLEQGIKMLNCVEMYSSVEANILFCRLPESVIKGLYAQGFGFYNDFWAPDIVRFVTSFATTEQDVDHLISAISQLC